VDAREVNVPSRPALPNLRRRPGLRTAGLALLALLSLASFPALGQENSDCLGCHSDKTLTKKRAGKTVSIYVDEKRLEASAHKGAPCIGCHSDLAGKELPHDEKVGRPACDSCHGEIVARYSESLHGKAVKKGDPLAPRCQTCHGSHDVVKVKDPKSPVLPAKIPFLCGRCHREGTAVQLQHDIPQSRILENYTESIHGEALMKKGLTVAATCVSCHTSHLTLPHTDPRSSIARANIAKTCSACHSSIEEVHQKVIKGELWEKEAHQLPACVDCHQPHKVRVVFYDRGMADAECLKCHAKKDLKAKDGRPMFVDTQQLAASKHKEKRCSQCHSEVRPSLDRPCAAITQRVNCGSCHAQAVQQYQRSTHGQLVLKGDPNGPPCEECHGTHGVKGRTDPSSPTFVKNVPALCARCHREGKKAAVRYKGEQHEIIEHYTESIHGKGVLQSGLLVSAACTSCHTAHYVLPASNPESTVSSARLPETCGRCHHGVEEKFEKSIHSRLVSKSKEKLPVCDDCHTAHTIRRTDNVGFKLSVMDSCGKCHKDVTETYFATFHGKVSQLGYAKTAKCYDCHGAHDILPPTNSASHLSRENVVQTCQKCHPGATRRFAGYLTHATHHDKHRYPVLFFTFWGMTLLLVGTFTISGLHTLMWLPRALQMRKQHLAEEKVHDPTAKQYVRFTRLERTLHICLIVSFITLALTGLSLKFSYMSWAVNVARIFGGFESAGYIHRTAAVLMFTVFVTHIVDMIKRKRREKKSWKDLLFGPNTMLPTMKDARDVRDSVKWFLGRGPRPQYGRWTYWEKFDYFAVFWGVFIIGSTGLLLWFSETFTQFLPGWLLNVATIVHSDEALLAVGFIFTIHFFNTHLRPEKFPMDIVVFTGRMPVEELKRDKPAEYEEMVKSGKLEENLGEAYQPIVLKAIRAFGWTALTLGFLTVLWIIYAMVFAYK
jgi:cytochrome b subunit of formate dehydrogenase